MIPLDSINAIYLSAAYLLHSASADFINGMFELAAGLFVLNHCRVLRAHRQARGVSVASVAYFTLWGLWNLYYYPSLHQPVSFYGGMFVTAANALYVGMLVSYRSGMRRRADVRARGYGCQDEHAVYLGIEADFPRGRSK